MQLETLKEPPATEPGNYFVATYPPFSVWSPEHLPRIVAALDEPQPATPLGLYLHIPFCRNRCKFCYFRVYTDKNSDDVEVYLDALTREVALYSKQRGLRDRHFEFVYFGGGTPSFLSNVQLQRLVDKIREHWTWDAAREVTFECEPGTLKQSKLQTIRDIGVTRLSLGVEHFNDEVLAINGRAHRSPEILRSYQWIRDIGFPQVNIDLIAGMVGDTEDKWKATVEKAVEIVPDSVTIYQMEVPFNTAIAKEARAAGVAVANWATKRAWVDYAFGQFQSAGYVVSSAYTLVKPERHAGFVYRDSLWHGADLIGTGVASFGYFAGVHYQNLDSWETYIEKLATGQLPLNRAHPATPHQRLIREMILQLKLGRIDAGYFRRKFHVEIAVEFADAFQSLVEDGFATMNDDRIILKPAGLLRIDSLLPRFYEPSTVTSAIHEHRPCETAG